MFPYKTLVVASKAESRAGTDEAGRTCIARKLLNGGLTPRLSSRSDQHNLLICRSVESIINFGGDRCRVFHFYAALSEYLFNRGHGLIHTLFVIGGGAFVSFRSTRHG